MPMSIPQPHACFIQSVDDELVAEGGDYGFMGRAKLACLNMDLAPVPIFHLSAAAAKSYLVVAHPLAC